MASELEEKGAISAAMREGVMKTPQADRRWPDERNEIIARLKDEVATLQVALTLEEAKGRRLLTAIRTARATYLATLGLKCTVSGPDTVLFLQRLAEAEKVLREAE